MTTASVTWLDELTRSDADAVVANVRFRFNPQEGHDLFLVFNQDFNTDRFWGNSPSAL